MDIFKNWIISIVAIVMITMLLDIIIPKGSIKKYVNFVLGLMVMIIILKPILGLFSSSFGFDEQVFGFSYVLEKDQLQKELLRAEDNNTNQILDLYAQRIGSDIAKLVKKEQNVENVTVDVVINKDSKSKNLGEILGVDIFIKEGPAPSSGGKIESVRPVSVIINTKPKSDKESYNSMQDQSYDKLKNSISNFYNIGTENISIYIQKND